MNAVKFCPKCSQVEPVGMNFKLAYCAKHLPPDGKKMFYFDGFDKYQNRVSISEIFDTPENVKREFACFTYTVTKSTPTYEIWLILSAPPKEFEKAFKLAKAYLKKHGSAPNGMKACVYREETGMRLHYGFRFCAPEMNLGDVEQDDRGNEQTIVWRE